MSSPTRTPKFEDAVREGLEQNDLTPEAFDEAEGERRRRMARAFAGLDDDAETIKVDAPASKDESAPKSDEPAKGTE